MPSLEPRSLAKSLLDAKVRAEQLWRTIEGEDVCLRGGITKRQLDKQNKVYKRHDREQRVKGGGCCCVIL